MIGNMSIKRDIHIILLALVSMMGQEVFAQNILADFENGTTGQLKLNTNYDGSLFSVTPRVRTNPSKTGINTSDRCIFTTNVANASWWKNFLIRIRRQS